MEARYYQEDAGRAVFRFFEENQEGNPVVAMPTGTGKSIVIAWILREIFTNWPDQRVLVLTHVKELIEQNFKVLKCVMPDAPAGIYSAGLNRRELGFPITFGGIASVAKRGAQLGFVDLVFVDECHLVSHREDTSYRKLLDVLKILNPGVRVIGLSATPYRLGHGHITDGGVFTHVCYDITQRDEFTRLISEGYLAPLVPRRTEETIDVSRVKITGGEFNAQELQAAVDRETITNAAVEEMIKHGQERKHWLIFCAGVDHATHVAERLRERGIAADTVHSEISDEDRRDRIAAFKEGHLRAVTNNNVLTTGFDFPAIDLIGMLRPTTSPGLWVQMLGRGTRPCDGKTDCLVLDFAGNTRRLGPINDPVIRKKGQRGPSCVPVKLCDLCGTYNHISATHCTSCGKEFARAEKIKAQADTAELIAPPSAPRPPAPPVSVQPVQEWFDVESVSVKRHIKEGSPDSAKVTYISKFQRFSEWVCFSHTGFARRKAEEWWRSRACGVPPASTTEFLQRHQECAIPWRVKVDVTPGKYPTVLDRLFDADGAEIEEMKGRELSEIERLATATEEDVPF